MSTAHRGTVSGMHHLRVACPTPDQKLLEQLEETSGLLRATIDSMPEWTKRTLS